MLWVAGLTLAGYLFGNMIWVQHNLSRIIWALVLVPGLFAVFGAWKTRQEPTVSLEAVNRSLFALISAPVDLSGLPLWLATLAAKGSIFVLAALLIWTWLAARPGERRVLERLILAVPFALALNYVIGLAYPHPRPFMIGLSRNFLGHSAAHSFPSDHASLMWTVALGMLVGLRSSWAGGFAIVLAALTSWARVFLGVHFPFDILGSMAVALAAVVAVVAVVALLPKSAEWSLAALWPADRRTPARAADPPGKP